MPCWKERRAGAPGASAWPTEPARLSAPPAVSALAAESAQQSGRVAQRKSIRFTPGRSGVRSSPRPPMPGPAGAHSPTCCGAGPASPVGRPRTGPDAAGQEPSRIRDERPRNSRSRPSCRPIQGPRSPRIVPCPSGIVPWTDAPLRPRGGRRKCIFGETFRPLGGGCREAAREAPRPARPGALAGTSRGTAPCADPLKGNRRRGIARSPRQVSALLAAAGCGQIDLARLGPGPGTAWNCRPPLAFVCRTIPLGIQSAHPSGRSIGAERS